MGIKGPMRKFSHATESEGEAFRMSEAEKTDPTLTRTLSLEGRGAGGQRTECHLSWARKKGDKKHANGGAEKRKGP